MFLSSSIYSCIKITKKHLVPLLETWQNESNQLITAEIQDRINEEIDALRAEKDNVDWDIQLMKAASAYGDGNNERDITSQCSKVEIIMNLCNENLVRELMEDLEEFKCQTLDSTTGIQKQLHVVQAMNESLIQKMDHTDHLIGENHGTISNRFEEQVQPHFKKLEEQRVAHTNDINEMKNEIDTLMNHTRFKICAEVDKNFLH